MTTAAELASYASSFPSFRNRIINGDMRIDQRNAGGSVTSTNSQYVIDRWRFGVTQSSKLTAQQSSTAPTGFANSLLITSSSAYSIGSGDVFNINQPIEGFNFADLAWGTASAATITLSFWVQSSLTGTFGGSEPPKFGGSLVNNGATRSYPFSYTINAANTWEQKTITIAGDTTGTWVGATNGIGVLVQFGLGVGSTYSTTANAWAAGNYIAPTGATSVVGTSGATFYLTGVQLEEGTVATPFEHRPYGVELALCQRYYEKSFNLSTAPANNTSETSVVYTHLQSGYGTFIPISFKVPKRAAGASVIIYNPYSTTANRAASGAGSNDTFTYSNVSSIKETGFNVQNYSNPVASPDSTGNPIAFNWSAQSEL